MIQYPLGTPCRALEASSAIPRKRGCPAFSSAAERETSAFPRSGMFPCPKQFCSPLHPGHSCVGTLQPLTAAQWPQLQVHCQSPQAVSPLPPPISFSAFLLHQHLLLGLTKPCSAFVLKVPEDSAHVSSSSKCLTAGCRDDQGCLQWPLKTQFLHGLPLCPLLSITC